LKPSVSPRWLAICLVGALLAISLALAPASGSRASATTLSVAERLAIRQATAETVARLQAELQQGGTRRVIVGLDVNTIPESKLLRPQVLAQRDRIAKAQERLLKRVSLLPANASQRLETLPYILLELDPAELELLAGDPTVLSIQEDVPVPPALESSIPVVGANVAWALGYSGEDQAVAILDTGVDSSHPFLAGRILAEGCFSNAGVNGAASLCPGDLGTLTSAPGAGEECDWSIYGCDRGLLGMPRSLLCRCSRSSLVPIALTTA
jgi:subtilisin family serine protease